jgi:hypothetical protein
MMRWCSDAGLKVSARPKPSLDVTQNAQTAQGESFSIDLHLRGTKSSLGCSSVTVVYVQVGHERCVEDGDLQTAKPS